VSRSPKRSVGASFDAEGVAEEVLSRPPPLVERHAASRADTWHRLRRSALDLRERRSAPPPRTNSRWLVAASLLASAAALVTVLGLRHSRAPNGPKETAARPQQGDWTELALGSVGRLFVAPGSVFHLPQPEPAWDAEYVVDLESGEVCAQVSHRDRARQGAFIVQAPTVRAVAVGTRFCVSAGGSPEASWVVIEEGTVRVERIGALPMLAGMGSLVRGSGPEVNPAPATPPPGSPTSAGTPGGTAVRPLPPRAISECLSSPSAAAQESCLWRRAAQSDLGAQNALYLLAARARDQDHDGHAALSIWSTYLRRFPRGVLAAETKWAVIGELVDEGRYAEAVATSDDFLRASPDYFRAGELEITRGDLLIGQLNRPRDGEAAYRHALAIESRPFLREKALFGLGLSQERAGDAEAARADWSDYLREFPAGAHAAEVSRRVQTAP
jgi:hypothetical protein